MMINMTKEQNKNEAQKIGYRLSLNNEMDNIIQFERYAQKHPKQFDIDSSDDYHTWKSTVASDRMK